MNVYTPNELCFCVNRFPSIWSSVLWQPNICKLGMCYVNVWYEHHTNGSFQMGTQSLYIMLSYQYRDSHYRNKIISRPSYLKIGIFVPGKNCIISKQGLGRKVFPNSVEQPAWPWNSSGLWEWSIWHGREAAHGQQTLLCGRTNNSNLMGPGRKANRLCRGHVSNISILRMFTPTTSVTATLCSKSIANIY